MSLIDLDELALQARNEQARSYVREAVACYKAGAYRSSIVASWIAFVFDFLHKLRELELFGDKQAKKRLEEFEKIRAGGENKLKDALEFERTILDMAESEFELITPLEKLDLERLRDDRHRCAHPSMQAENEPYQPPAELARLHLRNVVDLFLSREPVQGKAALDRILADISSPYFPKKSDEARKALEGGPLRRARSVLIRNLLIALVRGVTIDPAPTADGQTRRLVALEAVVAMHRAVAEAVLAAELPKLTATIKDDALVRLLSLARRVPFAWSHVEGGCVARVEQLIKTANDFETRVRALTCAMSVPALKPTALARLPALSADELGTLIKIDPQPEYGPLALQEFADAGSFRQAETLIETLIEPLVGVMSPQDLAAAIKAVPANYEIWDAANVPASLERIFDTSAVHRAATAQEWKAFRTFVKTKTEAEFKYTRLFAKMAAAGL